MSAVPQPRATEATCRACGEPLQRTFVDLGMSPLANSYLRADQLNAMEPYYPLHVRVCKRCFLVQLQEYEAPQQIFSDYAYFSSYSSTWLEHAQQYCDQATERFALDPASLVVEVGSNDGYLLQYFVARGIPVLGIEPAVNVAQAAIAKGIPTLTQFFARDTAAGLVRQGKRADLLVGNNVLAHVPDVNSFVAGLKLLLAPRGVITLEFPHLLQLIALNQYDTIYHEHFSYWSFSTVRELFARHGLVLFDVEELATHGGSLRIFARHAEDDTQPAGARVAALLRKEESAGIRDPRTYAAFPARVAEHKRELLAFLIAAKREGKRIAGYGAPAKGNTLLNYCGIGRDFLDYTVDRSPQKQGCYLPGTHIPICAPERIAATQPDYLLILPWNLRDEIMQQMAHIRAWGGRFVVPIPRVEVLP